MTKGHLSETETQQYALDKSCCNADIVEHVQSCASCQANAEAYLQLFSSLREQPKPSFGFDLSNLVLPQLATSKSKFSLNGFFIYLLVFVSVAAIAIPAYLFKKYLLSMFTGVLPMTIYLILITAIAILIFQSLEMYRKYQKQMNALN
jgi:hypothetical protein